MRPLLARPQTTPVACVCHQGQQHSIYPPCGTQRALTQQAIHCHFYLLYLLLALAVCRRLPQTTLCCMASSTQCLLLLQAMCFPQLHSKSRCASATGSSACCRLSASIATISSIEYQSAATSAKVPATSAASMLVHSFQPPGIVCCIHSRHPLPSFGPPCAQRWFCLLLVQAAAEKRLSVELPAANATLQLPISQPADTKQLQEQGQQTSAQLQLSPAPLLPLAKLPAVFVRALVSGVDYWRRVRLSHSRIERNPPNGRLDQLTALADAVLAAVRGRVGR